MQVHNFKVVREVDVPLSSDFFVDEGATIATIVQGHEVQPWQARASFKIYCNGDHLTLCKDRLRIGKVQGTTICEIDLSNKEKRREYFVGNKSKDLVTSYFHNGSLYRVAKNKLLATEFYISVFDSTNQSVADFVVSKTVSYSDSTSYLRATDSKRVMNTLNVWDAVSNMDNMFVSVHPYDSSRVILKVGTNKKYSNGPVYAGLNPIGIMTSIVASALVTSLDQTVSSKDLYFYLIGNPQTGFDYWNGKGLLGERVDASEMFNPRWPLEYKEKVYADSETFVIGVYQEK